MSSILVGHLVPARAFLLPWRIQQIKDQPKTVLRTVEFVSWGGFAAIGVGLLLYSWISSHPLIGLTDVTVRAGVLGHAIGRLGCLALGCCYGRPTGLPFAVRYDSPQAKAVRVGGLGGGHRRPVPLYEAGYNLALFAFLNAIAFAGAPQGIPTATYLVLYGAGRFALETLRRNGASGWWAVPPQPVVQPGHGRQRARAVCGDGPFRRPAGASADRQPAGRQSSSFRSSPPPAPWLPRLLPPPGAIGRW
jgi:hypothetical protein